MKKFNKYRKKSLILKKLHRHGKKSMKMKIFYGQEAFPRNKESFNDHVKDP